LDTTKDVQVWSCGGGTQSGAIAALIGMGKLPTPDLCFMTDTGREKSGTWPFVDGFIRPHLERVGLELNIVKAESFGSIALFSAGGDVLLPGFTSQNGLGGKLSGYCSGRWKVDIGERYLRSLGIVTATNWIGISLDEMRRVRAQHRPWLKLWYPLIFGERKTRQQCIELIRSFGWKEPIPHSACKMCPNMRDDEWLDMQTNWPNDFAEAVQIEKDIQLRDPHFWMHPSCVSIDTVDFSAPPTDQTSMFPERGCTTGCFT
jgi:hypothetical protein